MELFPQALYSPDVAPSVYHMFGSLKATSHGQRFVIDDEVEVVERM